jgi:hypothetical protein
MRAGTELSMNLEHPMPKAAVDSRTSRTTVTYRTGRSVPAEASVSIGIPIAKPERQRSKRDVEAAVYSHIQALRRLGNTRINSGEIAKALGLTVATVNAVLPRLTERGVKQVG